MVERDVPTANSLLGLEPNALIPIPCKNSCPPQLATVHMVQLVYKAETGLPKEIIRSPRSEEVSRATELK
ncbi:hypothetical protein E4U59_005897, partial [Claviceps monticola]